MEEKILENNEQDIAIKITGLKKRYRLGTIGGGTLVGDIQSWWARVRHKEDPNSKIGSKQYSKHETFMALDGIDLTVKKGEKLGIIGHNGAGKSTLLKLLSRVTGPTEGEICLDGRISSMLEVGTGFNGELTGRENIYLNGAILGMSKAEVDRKMDSIIEFSEVRQFIDTPVKRYSSGMYVKLAFSVAAHLDSEILIMDEVLAVGDMNFQKKCLDKMSQVSEDEGRTILYVSHNMNTIRQLCDRCIVLDHGKIIFNGDVEEAIAIYLKADPHHVDAPKIDYNQIPRVKWLKDPPIRTVSAEFVGKEDIKFTREEKMRILLKWETDRDVENVHLRVEMLKHDKTPIGSYIMENIFSGKKGDKGHIEFIIDNSNFVGGKYRMIYSFFVNDEFGNSMEVDSVFGLNFEITSYDSNLVWVPRYWGNLKFDNFEIIDK